MEDDGEVGWGALGPVEEETGDGLEGLTGEIDRDGLARVCEVGLPFRRGGSVDGGDGELAGLVVVRGCDGEALSNISRDGGDVGNVPVVKGDGSVGWELVCSGLAVADLHRYRGVGKGVIGRHEWLAQSGHRRVGLISNGRYRPTLPIERPILEIWDLRRQRWVEVESEVWSETQT